MSHLPLARLASRVATATVIKLIVTVLEDRDFILGFILLTEDAASASASEEKKCCCHFQGLNKAEFYQLWIERTQAREATVEAFSQLDCFPWDLAERKLRWDFMLYKINSFFCQ